MGRPKSFVSTLIVEQAIKSHNCRFNHTHRIASGAARLTAKDGRAKLRYCASCAVAFMKADIELLQAKIKELENASIKFRNSPGESPNR
jgi:hypothetical protein